MALHTEEDYERFATKAREALGIAGCLRLTGEILLAAAKHRGLIDDYRIVPDHLLPGVGGRYDPDNGSITVTQSVWDGSNSGNGRALFTVAHEVSHALLGHKKARNRSHARSAIDSAPSIQTDERPTERLAAALLAPLHLAEFTLETTVAQIAERFGLSGKAAKVRHEEFARMFRRARKLERPIPSIVIDFQEEVRRRGRPKGHNPVSSPPSALASTRPRSAKRIAAEAVLLSQSYDHRPCPKCGKRTLLSVGVKYLCVTPECRYVGDLPDGD